MVGEKCIVLNADLILHSLYIWLKHAVNQFHSWFTDMSGL